MSHCFNCKAPCYKSPCASCVSKGITITGPIDGALASEPSIKLDDFPIWRAFHNLAHRLHAKAASYPNYEDGEWRQLEEVIRNIAIKGLGNESPEPRKPPAAPQWQVAPPAPETASITQPTITDVSPALSPQPQHPPIVSPTTPNTGIAEKTKAVVSPATADQVARTLV